MNLEEAKTWFDAQHCQLSWLEQPPASMHAVQKLRPPPELAIDLAPLEAAIVIPDAHLGWGNDVFRFNDFARARRLERFLDALAQFRDFLGGKLDIVQLGDWYDFWRSPGFTHAKAKAIIESQYPGVVSRARALGVRHCVGNHDAAFAKSEIRSGLDVEIARTIGAAQRLLCFHGHDLETLASIAVDASAAAIGLNVFNLFNSTPLVGPLGAFVQRLIDGSSRDPWSTSPISLPWARASVPGPMGWTAPWTARTQAAALGAVISGFELCVGHEMQLVLVGHTHRPGISWSPVAGRRVPIVDVGSWTYGRTEFAVVCADGVGVARLV